MILVFSTGVVIFFLIFGPIIEIFSEFSKNKFFTQAFWELIFFFECFRYKHIFSSFSEQGLGQFCKNKVLTQAFWKHFFFLNVLGINIFLEFFRTRTWTTFGKHFLNIKKGRNIFKIVFTL